MVLQLNVNFYIIKNSTEALKSTFWSEQQQIFDYISYSRAKRVQHVCFFPGDVTAITCNLIMDSCVYLILEGRRGKFCPLTNF